MSRRPKFARFTLAAAIVVSGGCAQDSSTTTTTHSEVTHDDAPIAPGTIGARVAVYEQVVNRQQRFRVGLIADGGRLLSFGQVQLHFAYMGSQAEPVREPSETMVADASFLLVAGQSAAENSTGPRIVEASEGVGVYGTEITFDRTGRWRVRAVAEVDGERMEASDEFEVVPTSRYAFPGDPAPRTENRRIGDPGVDPASVDSRADDDGTIPDQILHETSVAEALDAGAPFMVVVSTPTFCVSRFCGPITDTVEQLARRYAGRMEFIHAEVWNDYERQAVNKEAAAWIYRMLGEDLTEPWVFLVGADGVIVDRWDNVSTDAELELAVSTVVR